MEVTTRYLSAWLFLCRWTRVSFCSYLSIFDDLYSSIHISLAQKEPYSFEAVREGEAKRIYENLSPEHYFRIQYQLLPSGGSQPAHVFKTDVVNFGGVVTKIYTDKFSRVIQCWPDFEEEGKGTLNTTNTFSWRHKLVLSHEYRAVLKAFSSSVLFCQKEIAAMNFCNRK